MKKLLVALTLLFSLWACDGTTVSPEPITVDFPGEPSPPPEPVKPPIVATYFSWEMYQGFTAFALGKPGQTEEDINALYRDALSYGWNTARICSETEFWDGSRYYLPTKPRDAKRLEWLLDTIARIPQAQVLLIGDCTLKRQVPLGEAERWARTVANIASRFPNVAIETHNEFSNCRGREDWGGRREYCPGKVAVAEHVRIYRSAGIEFVTADDRLGPDDFPDDIGFRLANVGAYPADFHPQRVRVLGRDTPWDPARRQLRQLVERNGMVLLSETVAWGDDGECAGLRTCDRERLNRYISECALVDDENGEAGCKFTYHSVNLLGGESPGWWPQAR